MTATLPADLYGKHQHDPGIRFIDAVARSRLWWSGVVNRRNVRGRVDNQRFEVVVADRITVARDQDVVALYLTAPDGSRLPRWRPGAHLDLELPSGRLRQYSLCGDPEEVRSYRIAVRRIPNGGGGSREVHDELPIGTRLFVRGPRNAFPFALPGYGSPAERLHFVAGGIGITPILPMARLAHRMGVPTTLVYTGRSRDSLPFLREVWELSDVIVRTDDDHGLPTPADLLPGVGPGTAIYACGPTPMTAAIAAAVRAIPAVELHYERFSPPPVTDGCPFDVELRSTGEIVHVDANRTLLDALLDVRPDQPYSCRQGFCRTCVVRVVDGEVDHREHTLSEDEHASGAMLTCVSRCAGTRLVLDL
ncbi:PDR/VanB family oxidoreductase [Nocardia camponoti]|uniref:Oxidoreductase n=1 Tax=Nocardia camponoti TaxID=1616106 RepID=A0A917QPL4_9NOCA|nr:PDR/VanB family oxidoreductase [Nocardia camponoti]GGK62063.1 putative oxidoreductase [Nocardia camponoti]